MILPIILVMSLLLYMWAMDQISKAWRQIPDAERSQSDKTVSVLVVYRNEELYLKDLIESLRNQEYPYNLVEYIFIDDHSDDDSFSLVEALLSDFKSDVQHVKLEPECVGKKNGLQAGIELAKNDWILTTDADCTVSKNWVKSMSSMNQASFVSGPVKFRNANNLWGKLVDLDFVSMIVLGGSLIQKRTPVLANGANMFYNKQVFKDVKGYNGNIDVASGDDVFLLEKIASNEGYHIHFNKNVDAIVSTRMVTNVFDFIQQRIRWAKKTQYSGSTRSNTLLRTLLGFYFVLIFCFITVFFSATPYLIWTLCSVMLIKILVDLQFFKSVLPFFGKSNLLPFVVIVDFLHPFYMTIIAFLSWVTPVSWKKRKYKNG